MPRTKPGKMVKQHGILINVREDGSVHIEFEGPVIRVDMLETQAIAFRELLTDVISWEDD